MRLSQAQPANEFAVWGGGSFQASTLIGKTEDAKLGVLGLCYARLLTEKKNLSLKYTIDVLPAVVLNYSQTQLAFRVVNNTPAVVTRTVDYTVYGAGLAPIGLQMNFRPKKKAQPFVATSGGFLYFSQPVPNSAGKQFNFTADLSGGLQIMTSEKRAVTMGYKYHHLSNAYRGDVNPGYDSNVFYVGFSFFK
jgi:hypothetical protein